MWASQFQFYLKYGETIKDEYTIQIHNNGSTNMNLRSGQSTLAKAQKGVVESTTAGPIPQGDLIPETKIEWWKTKGVIDNIGSMISSDPSSPTHLEMRCRSPLPFVFFLGLSMFHVYPSQCLTLQLPHFFLLSYTFSSFSFSPPFICRVTWLQQKNNQQSRNCNHPLFQYKYFVDQSLFSGLVVCLESPIIMSSFLTPSHTGWAGYQKISTQRY